MAYSEAEASRARQLADVMQAWDLAHLVNEREQLNGAASRLERELESVHFRYRVLQDVLCCRVRDAVDGRDAAVRVTDQLVAILEHGTVQIRRLVAEPDPLKNPGGGE